MLPSLRVTKERVEGLNEYRCGQNQLNERKKINVGTGLQKRLSKQGTLTEEEGSVRLTSLYYLI
jgi:hypothetical protein